MKKITSHKELQELRQTFEANIKKEPVRILVCA